MFLAREVRSVTDADLVASPRRADGANNDRVAVEGRVCACVARVVHERRGRVDPVADLGRVRVLEVARQLHFRDAEPVALDDLQVVQQRPLYGDDRLLIITHVVQTAGAAQDLRQEDGDDGEVEDAGSRARLLVRRQLTDAVVARQVSAVVAQSGFQRFRRGLSVARGEELHKSRRPHHVDETHREMSDVAAPALSQQRLVAALVAVVRLPGCIAARVSAEQDRRALRARNRGQHSLHAAVTMRIVEVGEEHSGVRLLRHQDVSRVDLLRCQHVPAGLVAVLHIDRLRGSDVRRMPFACQLR